MPENYRIGGGAVDTTITPIVLGIMLVAVLLILLLPRKYVIVPAVFTFFLVPTGQMILLGGYHLYVARIVILVGCMRAVFGAFGSKEDVVVGGWNPVDKAFLAYVVCDAMAVIILFGQAAAVVNQMGYLWDYLGGYFLLRYLIRDEDDIFRVLKCFAAIAFVLSLSMFWERITLHNVFGYLGGKMAPELREDRVRAQGPFEHELMAGAFAANLLPLFCLLWKNGKAKIFAAAGILGAAVMTWTTNSSTPLVAYLAAIFALCVWPFRKRMRAIRWGIVAGLIALQLVMKAPVWFVIAHVDLTGSSSSYHRAALVDQFIRHFGEWWLIGTNDAANWGLDMWDAQNQFVNVGETGGLLALIIFIVMISRCFARLGNARKVVEGDRVKEWFIWCIGSTLFAHVVSFFGVNYFDQSRFAWFALLAIVSATTAPILQAQVAEVNDPPILLTRSGSGKSVKPIPELIGSRSSSLPSTLQRTRR